MNTFFLRHKETFNELHADDALVILTNLQEAIACGNCISIRGQDASLYGCYQLSPEEVADYYRNGGQWSYLDPAPLYAEFTGGRTNNMKILVNNFHHTSMKSKLSGYDNFEDLQMYASDKSAATLKRIENGLCPHSKKNCACSAFIKQL